MIHAHWTPASAPPPPCLHQVFFVQPPIDCAPGDVLGATIRLSRKPENHRLLKVRSEECGGCRRGSGGCIVSRGGGAVLAGVLPL